MRVLIILGLWIWSSVGAAGQQTVGLFTNTEQSFDGYTLFAPIDSYETYLIDNCGEKIHSWTSAYKPGLSCYLLENGMLLRPGRVGGPENGSGIVEIIDWEGNVVWEYSAMEAYGRQHHDVEMLPNGNILLIVWDERSRQEVEAAGSTTEHTAINSEQIIEIQPNLESGGATVVWEWKAWDHLVQDMEPSGDNYGSIAQSPERIDVNFPNHKTTDWLHVNGVDYNPELDQIMISVHNFSEIWIIDHSTTTGEAAGSSGGRYGRGGDLLYRWGNPAAYDQGTDDDQQLFLQHDARWIEDGLTDAGKIMVFNNQAGSAVSRDYSTVNIINPPVLADGSYKYSGSVYGPAAFDWTYQAERPTDFFSNIISGAHRLPNGNTLICQGVGGRFFEVDPAGAIVWEYVNPVNGMGPISQGTEPADNDVFRCTRYSRDYPGLEGRQLAQQGTIEPGTTRPCTLFLSSVPSPGVSGPEVMIYPNPTQDNFTVEFHPPLNGNARIVLFDVGGRAVLNHKLSGNTATLEIDTKDVPDGSYILQISDGAGVRTEEIIIIRK